MINLKEALSGFKEKYGRNIEYNAKDQIFYEGRRPIRFETPAEADIEKAKANQVDSKISLNEAYESRLSPADKDLRKIIIKQTELEIRRELTKKSLMNLFADEYISSETVHEIWVKTKKILLEKYNLFWASPLDENPFTIFD